MAQQSVYQNARKKTDPLFAAVVRLRALIGMSFRSKGFKKNSKTFEVLGCGARELLDQWGVDSIPEGYHIDHVCPMAQAQTEEEAEKLCHYSNLRLLPGVDNMSKHANKTEEGEQLCRELLGREWVSL